MKRPMMMRSFAMGLLCGAVALTSCTDKDNLTPGSQATSSTGTAGNYVKGSIDDQEFRFAESPGSSVGDADAYYIVRDNGDIDVNIFRTDVSNGNAAMLYFVLKNGDVQTPAEPYMQITSSEFTMNSQESSNNLTVSNFSFDRATGRVTGQLELSGAGNSRAAKTTVKSDFDVVVHEIAI